MSTTRPLVAVTARWRAPRAPFVTGDVGTTMSPTNYIEGVWRAGANECVLSPRALTDDDADDLLWSLDGVLLTGGPDVDPARYGAEARPEVDAVHAPADDLELTLARRAVHLGVPVLAICRGLQVLNVALGGTLLQHLPAAGIDGLLAHGNPGVEPARHDVAVEPASLLAKVAGGATVIERCWSSHHQAVDVVAPALTVTARSADGVVEGLEWADGAPAGWLLAVQWHPERTAHEDAVQQAVFDAFADAARARRTTRTGRDGPEEEAR